MGVVTKRSSMTFFSSPNDHYCHRVRIVLAEKGVTVDIVDDDLPLLDVGIELALYDSNGTESSSGYLVAGTTATYVAFVTNTQTGTFSQPIVFDDSQTPDNSSDDVMFAART